MSKQTIWNFLKQHTALPDEAIAGIMGNMECESNCEACRLQGDFSADRNKSKTYAANVNSGALPSWHKDQQGWGLCQWTFSTRKANLKSTCESYGKGIEDEETQLRFMLAEMQMEFSNMWGRLLVTKDITEAARLVCSEYERPAVLNITARAKAGKEIYDLYHNAPIPDEKPSEDDSWILDGIEYWESVRIEIEAKINDLRGRLRR